MRPIDVSHRSRRMLDWVASQDWLTLEPLHATPRTSNPTEQVWAAVKLLAADETVDLYLTEPVDAGLKSVAIAGGFVVTSRLCGYLAHGFGRLGASAYCASKAGVREVHEVFAMELAEYRINVNCVSPGVIEVNRQTPQRPSRMNEEFLTELMRAVPWDGSQPDEVAQAVLYLCSPGAEYITGVLLPLESFTFNSY